MNTYDRRESQRMDRQLSIAKATDLRSKGWSYADIGLEIGLSRQQAERLVDRSGALECRVPKCDEKLAMPSEDGRCGFCIEQAAMEAVT